MIPHLRVARPTDDLPRAVAFYRDALGLKELGAFTGHDGFDGVMLGLIDSAGERATWHLELTHQRGHVVGRAPTKDNLLVLYIPERAEFDAAVSRMRDAGHQPVPSYNPYWDKDGVTFEDPDGYRVVLQNAAWG